MPLGQVFSESKVFEQKIVDDQNYERGGTLREVYMEVQVFNHQMQDSGIYQITYCPIEHAFAIFADMVAFGAENQKLI